MEGQTFAFLQSDDFPGGFVLFCDYYERLKEEIDSKFEEIEVPPTDMRYSNYLQQNKYKVFKQKQIEHEQDSIRTGTEG